MADTFTPTRTPEVSSSSQTSYRTHLAQFGDGYEQRIADGINTRRLRVTLQWRTLTSTEADQIEAFFRLQGGWKRFDYTLPWESSPRKWRLESHARGTPDQNIYSVTADLAEVFDL